MNIGDDFYWLMMLLYKFKVRLYGKVIWESDRGDGHTDMMALKFPWRQRSRVDIYGSLSVVLHKSLSLIHNFLWNHLVPRKEKKTNTTFYRTWKLWGFNFMFLAESVLGDSQNQTMIYNVVQRSVHTSRLYFVSLHRPPNSSQLNVHIFCMKVMNMLFIFGYFDLMVF